MTNQNYAFDVVTSAAPASNGRIRDENEFDSKRRIYKKIRQINLDENLKIKICVKWKHSGDSNMVVMEIPLLTGYAPYVERDVV